MCKGPGVGKGMAYLEKGKKAEVFGEWSTQMWGAGEGNHTAGQRPDHEAFIMTCHGKKFGGLLNPVGSHWRV